MRARTSAFLVAVAAALVAATPAGAATVVGSVAVPASEPCAGSAFITSNTSLMTTPTGVATSVSINRSADSIGATYMIAVLRPQGPFPFSRLVTRTTGLQTVTHAGVTTIPVQMETYTGDSIAIWLGTSQKCLASGAYPFTQTSPVAQPAPGSLFDEVGSPFSTTAPAHQAVVEPDFDQDGFGDETQDQCPGVDGQQNGCDRTSATDFRCRVPALKGLTKASAKTKLQDAGCKLGAVKKKKLKRFTKKQKKNRVRTQTVKAGSSVALRTAVGITINVKKSTKK